MLWNKFFRPVNLAEALKLKAEFGNTARFVSGGTDMIIDLDRGRQPHCHLIDISQLTELHYINEEENGLRLGGGTTHSELLKSSAIKAQANILAQAAVEVGAPQIRNRSTLSGNIVTASPAADTVPPLLALDAQVELQSVRGKRELSLQEFITGFRQVGLAEDEMLVSIFIPRATGERRGAFLKLGLRNAQAISVISVAANLEFDAEGKVIKAGLAFGSVAPTVIRAPLAEEILIGKVLTEEILASAATAAMETAKPIADVRSSAEYRKAMVKVFTARALRYVRDGKTPPPSADPNIFLQLPEATLPSLKLEATRERSEEVIELSINGKAARLEKAGDMALLYALREAGFTGTKEGCLEGECGACTVLLNGKAVDSCLVPAPSAHGAKVITIEGLAQAEKLHPLQQSFIDMGGVQCGYCTPGLILSGSTLLAERPEGADEWQCRSALVGNLCRCTGYGRVLEAMQEAQKVVKHG